MRWLSKSRQRAENDVDRRKEHNTLTRPKDDTVHARITIQFIYDVHPCEHTDETEINECFRLIESRKELSLVGRSLGAKWTTHVKNVDAWLGGK